MTDRDVVERAARLLNRAVVTLRARRQHHRTPFAVTVQGAPAVDLMTATFNFMGSKRKAEIQRAVASWRRHRTRHREAAAILGGGHTCDVRCEIYWLAGLLEGEGTFTVIQTRGRRYPFLKVEMCAEDVVTRASRLMSAPSVARREPEHESWSASYVAAISGGDAAGWMRRLRTHMGHRRSEAIDAALATYHPVRLVDPPDSCVVTGCGEPHRGRGLCHKHYMMWSRDQKNGRAARIAPLR